MQLLVEGVFYFSDQAFLRDIAGEILKNYDNLKVEFTGGEIRISQTSGNEKDRRLNMERLFDKHIEKKESKIV